MRELLSPEELAALARLTLPHRWPQGMRPGAHLAFRAGYSLEFVDFRPYQPGDDYRLVDWSAYARLRKLLVRVYKREVEAPLYVLLDSSASMGEGEPPKLSFAVRLAAALGFIAHRGRERFAFASFAEGISFELPPGKGKAHLLALFRYLMGLEARGRTDINLSLSSWAERGREPGLCIVISDFLSEKGWEEGLSALISGRHEVVVVQVLSPQDLNPPFRGMLELVDAEHGASREILVEPGALAEYRRELSAWNRGLEGFAERRGMGYFLFPSSTAVTEAAGYICGRRYGVR